MHASLHCIGSRGQFLRLDGANPAYLHVWARISVVLVVPNTWMDRG